MNDDPPDTKIDPDYELSVFTTELLKICRKGASIWFGHKFDHQGICERCGKKRDQPE